MKRIEPLDQNAKNATGKVFDVMRPGRAPANATSKPVIVGPQMQDPSVSINGIGDRRIVPAPTLTTSTTPDSPRKIEVMSGMRSKPIEVPNDELEVGAVTPNRGIVVNAQDAPEQEVEALAEVAIDGANKGEKAWEPESSLPASGPLPALPADALMDSSAAPDLGTGTQGVVVSDHTATPKGSAFKTILLIFVALLLAVAIFDLLLDANIITIDAVPHTHFLQ